jgi:hypothetical protein
LAILNQVSPCGMALAQREEALPCGSHLAIGLVPGDINGSMDKGLRRVL